MFLWAFVITLPLIGVLLLGCLLVRAIAPRRKALHQGLLVGSITFWVSMCLFCEVPIGQATRDAHQEGADAYYVLRALGFVPCNNGSPLVFWNILVFASWLALLGGVMAYWHKRSTIAPTVRPPAPPH